MGIFGMKRVKPRRCKSCKESFLPLRPLQSVCSPKCAHDLTLANKAKLQKREDGERKEALKTRTEYAKEAQQATNAYVRERDKDRPCISCGRYHDGQWHAGHYISTGARPSLRYHADTNIHRQCAPCNTHLSGNLINYRIRLVELLGQEIVEGLESDHTIRKYTKDELIEIRDFYRAELKRLKRESND